MRRGPTRSTSSSRCCGNINAFPLQGGLDAAAAAGRDLGQVVERAAEAHSEPLAPAPLRVVSRELTLPLQAPAAEIRERLAQEPDAARKERWTVLLALAEGGKAPTMRYPIRAFRLARDLCLVGLPHDTFAEYHAHAERASRFAHTLVFGYSNGLESYVGTKATTTSASAAAT